VRRPPVVRPAAAGPLALAWALSAPAGQGPGAAVDLRPGAAAAGEELGAAPTGRRLWAGRRADGIGPAAPPVLLVDDVLTTGATLLDAERALARAGRATLGAVVLAVSPREARPRPEGGGLGAPDAHDGQSFD
jgi:hypothetical protein